jgi:predicted GH43/DUF377 family glycosyl hydrolase
MSAESARCVVFDVAALLPDAWKTIAGNGPVRVFNPGLLPDGNGWLFAYRLVAGDGLRRIALCRLNDKLQVLAGSPAPLTDFVRFRAAVEYPEIARRWFADPRLYRLGGRLFIYWNSGWHEPRNYQFVQELEPRSLRPQGPPRELLLREPRQKLEKNWTFFAGDDLPANEFRAVYSISPHRVLAFSLAGEGDVTFEECAQREWSLTSYPPSHGGLRGGAPPVRLGDRFWSFCHSVHGIENEYAYLPATYSFDAKHPFTPRAAPTRPLAMAGEEAKQRLFPRLNTAVGEVIYPCGAAWDGTRWLISHGINDERCAISVLDHAAVAATVQDLPSP